MDLERIFLTMAQGRERDLPVSQIAKMVGMPLGEFTAFEQNFVKEFHNRYRGVGNVGETIESLGWPFAEAEYATRVYGFANNEKGRKFPLFRKIVPELFYEENEKFVLLAALGVGLEDLGKALPDNGKNSIALRARCKLNSLNLFSKWKRASKRTEGEKMNKARSILLNTFAQRAANGEAYTHSVSDAAWSFTVKRSRKVPSSDVSTILKAYFQARNSTKDISVLDVQRATGIPYEKCRYVLREAKLKIKKHREKMSNREKIAIATSPLSKPDVVALTNLSMVTLGRYASQLAFPNDRSQKLYDLGTFDHRNHLRYRDASEIYEAQDAGFSTREIAKLTEKQNKVVKYALENRTEIEKPIVLFLRAFYGLPRHDKPYKTSTMKTLGSASKV